MHGEARNQLNPQLINRVTKEFRASFSKAPDFVVHAPGRINLIGEHTDYNSGFVLPGAVACGIYFAVGRATEREHIWYALDLGESTTINIKQLDEKRHNWVDYILGACHHLTGNPRDIPPFRCVFSADLPRGSGLSSSSALTCGTLLALQRLTGAELTPVDLALTAHRVERAFIGLQGGIMDQFACMLGRPGHLIAIDCRDNTFQYILLGPELKIFLFHSNVHRELSGSAYNSRTRECLEALKFLRKKFGVQSLRDVTFDHLAAARTLMPDTLYRRAHFVVSENQRVQKALHCIAQKSWVQLGQLLKASHHGLRDDYEVSCPELDFLQDCAEHSSRIYGGRMMGGGFGGCTINIASSSPGDAFIKQTTQAYHNNFGLLPTYIPITLGGGAQIL